MLNFLGSPQDEDDLFGMQHTVISDDVCAEKCDFLEKGHVNAGEIIHQNIGNLREILSTSLFKKSY
jgi:hypothetical protein